MNRRDFTARLTAGAALGVLAPMTAAAQTRVGNSIRSGCWSTPAACNNDIGLQFNGAGPTPGNFQLIGVDEHNSSGRGHQFTARFSGPDDAAEGVYRLRTTQRDLVLFLQPVAGQPGRLDAVISHVG